MIFCNDKVRKLRRLEGLSMHQLGDKVGVAHTAIHRWESGFSEPRPSNLKKLAKALKVKISDLFENVQVQ